jgi:Integrase core domain
MRAPGSVRLTVDLGLASSSETDGRRRQSGLLTRGDPDDRLGSTRTPPLATVAERVWGEKDLVWRILKRLDMSRLPTPQRHRQRWKRYEKQRPGHHVQIDVKFIEPIISGPARRKRYYQYTAIDDCTRLRVLRIYPHSDQKTAIQFLDYVVARLPFKIEKIQTDNSTEFQSGFHWHVIDQGIGHTYIRPATPRLNGKVCEDCGSALHRAGLTRSRYDPGVPVVSFVRFVGWLWCSAVVRT